MDKEIKKIEIPVRDLDIKDRRILRELYDNGRVSFSAIAKKAGLSTEVVNYRVNGLIKKGVLIGFNTVIDVNRIGWQIYFVYMRLRNVDSDKENEIINFLTNHSNAAQLIRCIGNYDFILKFFVRDYTEINNIMKDIEARIKPSLEKYTIDFVEEEHPIPFPFLYAPIKPDESFKFEKISKKRTSVSETDLKILRLLANNARMPLTEIAKKLELPRELLRYHLRKLEKDKIIRKYRPSAWLGTMSMGFSWFFVMLKIEKLNPAVKNTLFTYLLNIPQMTYYYNTIGTYDICFEIRLMQTSSELTNLLREIRNILKNSLKGHELSIILREDKYTYFPDCVMNIQN